jgi:hypothetical protein
MLPLVNIVKGNMPKFKQEGGDSKMKKNLISSAVLNILGGAMLVGFISGCARQTVSHPIAEEPREQVISFPEVLQVPDSYVVNNPNDPKQLVEFAILFFNYGNYEMAREYFLRANKMAKSEEKAFERSTFAAAMLSVLKGGNIEEFTKMETTFEEEYLTEAERLNPPAEFAGLITLGRYVRGELREFPISTPNDVRSLLNKLK